MAKYNPFKPGSIVSPGMFVGRIEEVQQLTRILSQVKQGNPQHFLIHGERGIGKSSLLLYLRVLAEGKIESLDKDKFDFLTLEVELEPETTYAELIQRIATQLKKKVDDLQKLREFAKTVWEFITRWEVLGVKYVGVTRDVQPHDMLDELTESFAKLAQSLKGELDGVLLLIDEADKPPYTTHLGEFVKLFSEKLTKRGASNISIGLSGISTVINKLKKSHESSLRVLQMFALQPLLSEERIQVVNRALEDAKEKNGFETTIAQDAQTWISEFSQGYPHFIQQFGYSAFEQDTDNNIDLDDVVSAAIAENGAFAQLGTKYFHDLYFDKIGSDEYRQVLRAMAHHSDNWVTKKALQAEAKVKSHTLNNAINVLKKRNIIIPQEGKAGVYRLPSRAFAVWIRAFTQQRVTLQEERRPSPIQNGST
jgi:DNA polymerase III delta prime subunit